MVDFSDPTWIIAIASVIAVVISYADMRRRLKQDQDASKAMLELIAALKAEVASRGNLSQQDLALKDRELKMKETMNTIRTIKFLADTARSLGLFDED